MIDSIFSVVPVEFRPMSIISLLLIMVLAFVIRMNMTNIKSLSKELNDTKDELNMIGDGLNNQIKDIMLNLKVDIAELKVSMKNVSSCLGNMKSDIRDLRMKKR